MLSTFLVFALSLFHPVSTESLDGVVLTENGDPIEGVHVFFRGYLQSGVTTDSKGHFHFADIKSSSLIFSHVSYEEREIALETLKNGTYKVILSENQIMLKEIVVLPDRGIDINPILDSIQQNYYKNTSFNTHLIHSVAGEHLAIEGTDTLIYIKSPFFLEFDDYPKLDANSDITFFAVKDSSILHKGKTYYTLPYTSEVFLLQLFKWLNIKNLNFITKPKNYNYEIKDLEDSYLILFSPLKEKQFLYYGQMEVLKENYMLKEVDTKLVFDKKNYYDVISLSKKYPGSRYFYETMSIRYRFKQDEKSKLYNIESMNASVHIGREINETDKKVLYTVKTDLQFNRVGTHLELGRGIDLMEYLYIDPEKMTRSLRKSRE